MGTVFHLFRFCILVALVVLNSACARLSFSNTSKALQSLNSLPSSLPTGLPNFPFPGPSPSPKSPVTPSAVSTNGFAGGNAVRIPFGIAWVYPMSMAVQSDGKIIYVGGTGGEESQLQIARYNADGTIDTSFGKGGMTVSNYGTNSYLNGVAIQSDGKIVASGDSGSGEAILIRYNSDGTVDSTFAVVVMQNSAFLHPAIQLNGQILVSTGTSIYRFNSDGTADAKFGNSGNISAMGAFALQANQQIVYFANGQATLGRANADGSIDSTFNAALPSSASTSIDDALAIQSDGKIVVGGDVVGTAGSSYYVARYNPDGTADAKFGSNGVFLGSYGGQGLAGWGNLTNLVVLANGNIFGAGISGTFELNANGSADSSYVDKIGYMACALPAAAAGPGSYVYVNLACSGGGTIYQVTP